MYPSAMVKAATGRYKTRMNRLRPLIAGLLSLILMVGSVTTAVARADMAGATEVTLCGTDGTLTTLQIDATGKPVRAGHGCQHCLAAAAVAILSGPVMAADVAAVRRDRLLPGLTMALPPVLALAPVARGPPFAI